MFYIITDSSAYFTRREAERLGVRVLPMQYSVDSKALSEGYLDENGCYKEMISKGKRLHTSQVSSSSFLSAFSELRRKEHDVLCLTISSRLSGAYSGATMTAKELDSKHILVVDSLSTVGGLKFLVEKACALSREGCSLLEATDILEKMRDRIGIAFSVDDMEALRRSGRLGFVRQSVGTMLNLRPILLCKHGTVVSAGMARGKHAQLAQLARIVPEGAKRIEVHYIADQDGAWTLREALKSRFACEVTISEVGPVIAIHLGMNAIGVAWSC